MPDNKRSFPGRLTLEEWLVERFRWRLVERAQADLLGSFRLCANKRCRRLRGCCSDTPDDCRRRLSRLKKVKPKTLLREWARLDRLKAL
jgi:hypothetical protein